MIGAGALSLSVRGAGWFGLALLLACAQPAWAQAVQEADPTGYAADTEAGAADEAGEDGIGDVDDTEEIVVTARVGKIAFVFDRRANGKLENCRVFTSSGIPALDETACEDLTDCVMHDNGKGMCDGEIALAARQEPASIAAPTSFTMPVPKLVEPVTPKIPAIGPVEIAADEDDRNRLGKLAPPPSEPGTGAIITLGNPDAKRKAEEEKNPFSFGRGE